MTTKRTSFDIGNLLNDISGTGHLVRDLPDLAISILMELEGSRRKSAALISKYS